MEAGIKDSSLRRGAPKLPELTGSPEDGSNKRSGGPGREFSMFLGALQEEQLSSDPANTVAGRVYRCACGKAFKYNSLLRRHQCTECGKAFKQSSILLRHRLIHTEEKCYQCSGCGKAFGRSSRLRQHQKFHSGERPYECGECGKAFCRRFTLQEHCRIHSGERPYACHQCGQCFIHRSSLLKHHRLHTEESHLLRTPSALLGFPLRRQAENPSRKASKAESHQPSSENGGGWPCLWLAA
ncbi:hypothetical protein MC885_008761 [Smutsia gigantea]|nr:hypothetical protein MC885_008761 [Smutsia gigantea]